MTRQARGPFEVTITPQPSDSAATSVGRMALAKVFHGDLEATSLGQMLAIRTAVAESGGYVAMEEVTGTLHGRSGAFALQHSGTMARGTAHLTVTVVPDSGIGELTGLSGTMTIDITDGQHSYTFSYTLPAAAEPSHAFFPKGIGAPATRALTAAGYTELRQLAGVPVSDLKKIHGIGPKALALLAEALKQQGLSLG